MAEIRRRYEPIEILEKRLQAWIVERRANTYGFANIAEHAIRELMKLIEDRRDEVQKRRGFTLIELMIVVAIIGILAAVALPAYQDYSTRAKVAELILAIDGCKTSVTEYYQSQADWPADQKASGCSDQQTQYVATLVVGAQGTITATAKTGPGALDPKAAGDVQFVPTVTATGQITWVCSGAGTTIPAKYLPALCRG